MYPNPFVDYPIEYDRKQYCGKCYKLDHRNKRCEKFNAELKLLCPGRMPVFEKCEECKVVTQNNVTEKQ